MTIDLNQNNNVPSTQIPKQPSMKDQGAKAINQVIDSFKGEFHKADESSMINKTIAPLTLKKHKMAEIFNSNEEYKAARKSPAVGPKAESSICEEQNIQFPSENLKETKAPSDTMFDEFIKSQKDKEKREKIQERRELFKQAQKIEASAPSQEEEITGESLSASSELSIPASEETGSEEESVVWMRNSPPMPVLNWESIQRKLDPSAKDLAIAELRRNFSDGQSEFEYSKTTLLKSGNGTGVNLVPFQSYTSSSPYTYKSKGLPCDGAAKNIPLYPITLMCSIINKYDRFGNQRKDPIQRLQESLQSPNNNRALQIAAVLNLVGDGLSPLPKDCNVALGACSVKQQSSGTIEYLGRGDEPNIKLQISGEIVGVYTREGDHIGNYTLNRTIEVLPPGPDGNVTYLLTRAYDFSNLT
jgi:hypothetical protein